MNRIILSALLMAGLPACGDSTASTSKSPPAHAYDVPADDPARNLTPLNQGASTGDIQETTSIRKAIMATKGLSIDAQNIKIITANGLLTLRGLVDSIDEHKQVCQVVEGVIGKAVYDDQITVKP
jgi:hyperosmotically inducible protein